MDRTGDDATNAPDTRAGGMPPGQIRRSSSSSVPVLSLTGMRSTLGKDMPASCLFGLPTEAVAPSLSSIEFF